MGEIRISRKAVFETLVHLIQQSQDVDSRARKLISNIIFTDGTPATKAEKIKYQKFYEGKRYK